VSQIHYIGIDPGKSNGGLAIINELGRDRIVRLHSMPVSERDQWEMIRECDRGCDESMAMIEWINPGFFGIQKSAAAKLYGNYMAMRAFLTAAMIPFQEVKAVQWQRAVGIAKRMKSESDTDWKNRIKGKAQQLFPDRTVGPNKITLKNCDALLIAEHLRRTDMRELME
jgi:hypothetical protein